MCNLLTSVMETKVTSKTSSLKALLLRAWRERWSDLQWGINIKTILPRGVSGDVYNLADCILQQALVGLGPNQLVLSYLKHSLSSQLVSYAAVLQRISKYDAFHKPHCILSLLEFLESIQIGITCRGKPEEDLLAAAVLSIVNWLLQCYLHTLTKMPQNNPLTPQPTELMDKPASILKQMLSSDFLCAMMYLAKYDDKDLYIEVVKKCQEIEALLKTSSLKSSIQIEDSLKKLCNLEDDCLTLSPEMSQMESITHCLQPLFAVQVLLNPSTETSVFVNQMLMVQRLKNYTNTRLYCEIIRACLMCLHNVTSTINESQWGAFTFLKVPLILKELHVAHSNTDDKLEYSQDILDAFELLLQFTPLLDIVDTACSCNSIECLLNALQKVNLVTEKQTKHLSSRREGVTANLQKLEISIATSSIPKVIVRAEPTLSGILKTLNADYTKIHEALLSMLYQVLTGNSFELILAVATVEGKLKTFVTKLIKFNECSKQINEPVPPKTAAKRAMLFDISFLMLCSIVQTYGSDAVLEEGEGDSFFEQWVREYMPERNQPKSPQKMLQNIDPARVDALLAQINSPDPDLKSSNIKWHIACQSAMGAVKELLCAWESDVLGASDVKRALDGLRATACCLPVCAAAWLCAHMSITHQDALLKPLNMVQHFLTPLPGDEMQDNLKEFLPLRSSLMSQIIRKMQYDVHPPTQSKTKVLSMSHSIISRQPILEQLETVWGNINQRGWINIQATQSLESLLNTGGSLWFVTNIVKEVLKYRYQEELDQAVDLAFAIFHLDIENCTLDLINHIIPQYLYNSLQSEELVEPQSSVLAKLCVYCIFSTLEYNNSSPCRGNSRKRVRRDLDAEELDALGVPANKILRLNEAGDSNPIFGSQSPQAQGSTNGQKSVVLRDPLLSALNGLFTIFTFLAGRDGEVSQQTHFILQFLRLMVQCGKDRTRIVLQGMPQTLVPCLLKALPELFTTDILLRFYDIQTIVGRKATARDLCMLRNINLKPSK
ncbi:mediator of RNA polymerase II transcription subunit 24 isoform X1 [Apis dorsata]|uniref:mediator of RNA polymerase II transcription subunit 24 isoform X1 n=1 Tax=Apis dorsata TaxID=7462 RepID=UPI0003DF6821|nr:mediator of RNA polymerase II transcription subunit 24 isoform X1 [Apis dorsata]XP_006610968.1 mediator of RNA polymerase II transcription subunit 24 isoform X1 [Apis dorsata]XP_031364102.1 mediator of RNA polymerase II transcription subunit 24 isoform X1 [Apis dorsata]